MDSIKKEVDGEGKGEESWEGRRSGSGDKQMN